MRLALERSTCVIGSQSSRAVVVAALRVICFALLVDLLWTPLFRAKARWMNARCHTRLWGFFCLTLAQGQVVSRPLRGCEGLGPDSRCAARILKDSPTFQTLTIKMTRPGENQRHRGQTTEQEPPGRLREKSGFADPCTPPHPLRGTLMCILGLQAAANQRKQSRRRTMTRERFPNSLPGLAAGLCR